MTPTTPRDPARAAAPPVTVRVFATADRGMAMGHIGGKVAFVPLAAPGDVVEVQVVREKRKYVETRLLRVLEPSPLRRTPPCPHFGACGGCQWQHLPYDVQLEAKEKSFRGFVRSRLGIGADRFRAPLPSPSEWGYRNRIGLKVRAFGGRVEAGYFAQGSHRLVPVETCPVAHPAIQGFLPPLRGFLRSFPPAAGSLPQVDVQADGIGQLWSVFHLLRPLDPEELERLGEFARQAGAEGTLLQAGRKETLTALRGEVRRMPFRVRAFGEELDFGVSPGGFVQANWAVNQALVGELAALSPLYEGKAALDLYAGAGNFTLPLALRASSVVAIEGYPPAARDAAANASAHGLDDVEVLPLPVAAGLERLHARGLRPEFALLDPPREGAAEAVAPLAALGPGHVLYVSCSPPTLVRDLKLFQAEGYRVEWLRAADMFPQTAHLESVTLLRRVASEA